MSRRPAFALAAVVLPTLLACSGLMEEATQQALAEQCQELEGHVKNTEKGRNQRRALKLTERCYVDASGGKFELVDFAVYAAKVQQMCADGEISDPELKVMQSEYEVLVSAGEPAG